MVGICGSVSLADNEALRMRRRMRRMKKMLDSALENISLGQTATVKRGETTRATNDQKNKAIAIHLNGENEHTAAPKRQDNNGEREARCKLNTSAEESTSFRKNSIGSAVRRESSYTENGLRDAIKRKEESQRDAAPYHTIEGVSNILRETIDCCESVLQSLRDASIASMYQTGILNDTLTLSKVTSGKVDAVLGPVDPSQVLDHCVSIVGSALHAKSLAVTVSTVPFDDVQNVVKVLSEPSALRSSSLLKTGAEPLTLPPSSSLQLSASMVFPEASATEDGVESERQVQAEYRLPSEEALQQGCFFPVLESDRRHVVKIISTLLSHSIKSTAKGLIEIRARLLPLTEEDIDNAQVRTLLT